MYRHAPARAARARQPFSSQPTFASCCPPQRWPVARARRPATHGARRRHARGRCTDARAAPHRSVFMRTTSSRLTVCAATRACSSAISYAAPPHGPPVTARPGRRRGRASAGPAARRLSGAGQKAPRFVPPASASAAAFRSAGRAPRRERVGPASHTIPPDAPAPSRSAEPLSLLQHGALSNPCRGHSLHSHVLGWRAGGAPARSLPAAPASRACPPGARPAYAPGQPCGPAARRDSSLSFIDIA